MTTIIRNKSFLTPYKYAASNLMHDFKKLAICNFTTQAESLEEMPCAEIQVKPKNKEFSMEATFSNGKRLKITCGKLAKFADGCATVTFGDATIMATAMSKPKVNKTSFVPLNVFFQQKAAALGRIPLNFLRREYGQNEYEILTSRMIDRSLRPLFPKKFNWETQIICNPLALDGNNFPDVMAINAASAAMTISDIPWNGPVGAVRLGLINENIIINPDKKELNESLMNLIVVSKSKNYVVMLEGSFKNITITTLLKAIKIGVKEGKKIITAINSLSELYGKSKRNFEFVKPDPEIYNEMKILMEPELKQILQDYNFDKISRDEAIMALHTNVMEKLSKKFENEQECLSDIFYNICKDVFRELIFETNIRCDGRGLNMLRNIECEVDMFKPLHGSALFQRGHTQVLCTVALDSPNSTLKLDRISMLTSGLKEKNFFVHYEFPPFATKEVGKLGPIGRREIGHGSLAEKALKANVPDNFPFTIRLTSEVLESNGSSSMATVCGGTLALLDAGVPLTNSCAGVAMGVITKWSEIEEVEDYRILTDLLGIEDYYGDMDFKIAGTKKFITAVQMDVKTPGLPQKIIMDTVLQAKPAICAILKQMAEVCNEPRIKEKENWPKMEKVTIPIHLRSKFIGPSGLNIKKLEMNAGVEIIENVSGEFLIFAPNQVAMKEVIDIIQEMLESYKEPTLEFGGVYTATIVEIKEHGCMVTLYPNMQPVLIHVSQLDHRKVAHPSALDMEVGQQIQVKYFGRDPVSGLMRLSRKVLQATGFQVPKTFFKKDAEPKNSAGDVNTDVS